jgi:hypothetical protein
MVTSVKKNAALAYYVEPTCGVCPTLSSSDALRFTRLVSEDLNSVYSRDVSNEVRGDAQSGGSVTTGVSGAGSISIQHSMETYDELIAGLMFSSGTIDGTDLAKGWEVTGFVPDVTEITNPNDWQIATNVLTLSTGDVVDAGIVLNGYIRIAGSGNAQLDGVWRVDAIATDAVTLEAPNSTQDVATYTGLGAVTLTTQTSMTIQTVQGAALNGTQDRSFGFVRFYSDSSLAGDNTASAVNLSSNCDIAIFRGAFVTSMQLSVAPGQAGWTGSLSTLFLGEESAEDATATAPLSGFAMATWDASEEANSNPLPDAIAGVANVKIRKFGDADGTRIDPLSLNMTISNNASEVSALRNAGSIAVVQGTFSASIDMEIIYEDKDLHIGMVDNESYEIEVAVVDSDDKCQMFRFPQCKLTSERPNPGQNAPIVQKLSFMAEPGGTDFTGGTGAKTCEVLRFYIPSYA